MAMAKNGMTATPRIIEILILISLKPWIPGPAEVRVGGNSPAIAARQLRLTDYSHRKATVAGALNMGQAKRLPIRRARHTCTDATNGSLLSKR
jgi:hypothetical protein